MDSKVITLKGEFASRPIGYSTFGFEYDYSTKKFAIANVSNKLNISWTKPFVDEIICSSEPLGTWAENYVVVRIGEDYFLADNEGNCYHKANCPFIICANVFVSGDKKYVINKELKKVEYPDMEIYVNSAGRCNVALIKSTEKNPQTGMFIEAILNSDGKVWSKKYEICQMCDANDVFERRMLINGAKEEKFHYTIFLTKDFDVGCKTSSKDELIGPRSKTYTWDNKFYSMYFDSKVNFRKFGELEVITYKGELYFFKFDGKIEKIPAVKIRDTGESLVYRQGETVFIRDYNGNIKKQSPLTPNEVYNFMLTEELIEVKGK